MSSPALIIPSSVNRNPNKVALKVPNNIPRNPPFCSYGSFLIVSLRPFINNPDYSRDSIIFMTSFITSLEIINIVVPDLDAVNPNGTKTLLANGSGTFLIKGNPVFSNGPKNLPKNPLDCPILCN